MSKEDIFSKISLKDYNNELEKVLEEKDFSEVVKNLLLSMLYKIENAYEDYETVKVNTASKKYFIKKIIKIINEKCNKIELIKPLTEESKELEENNVNYIVDKKSGTIKVYQNETMMLEAIVALDQNENIVDKQKYIFADALENILLNGNRMNKVEVIRDFNGWSWDITTSQIQSKNINLIYQNLILLLGNAFIQKWITQENEQDEEIEIPNNEILRSKYNESFGITKEELKQDDKIDFFDKMKEDLEQKYGEENALNFIERFVKTVIAIGCNQNEKQKDIILKQQEKVKEQLLKMQDNKTYIEEISNYKKQINEQIKQIDTLLSDENMLKEEYKKRNAKLPNKEKIFSVSHLIIMLEKQRNSLLKEIQKCNKQIQPKEFVNTKQKLEEKVNFFEDINVKENEKVNEKVQIENLQLEFLKCFEEKVLKVDTKKEIEKLLYELRYYEQISYNGSKVNKIKIINEQLERLEKVLIEKACNQKVLVKFSNDENLNLKILTLLFYSKIINLANTVYILKYKKGILKIEIYDTTIQEEEIEIQIKEKVELQVRLNKKIKVLE